MNLILNLNYISQFILSDLYIFYSEFKIYNFLYFINILLSLSIIRKDELNKNYKKLFFYTFIFIIYIFLIDLFKNETLLEALKNFLRNFGTISLLPITMYAIKFKNFKVIKSIKIILMISVFFAVLQIFGYRYMVNDLLSLLPIIKFEEVPYEFINIIRIAGANTNYIGFALFVSVLIIFYYNYLLKHKNLKNILIFMILIIVLLFNQTRAAIFSLFPIILLSEYLIDKKNFKGFIKKVIISILIIIPIYLIYDYFSYDGFRYIQQNIGYGDTHRLYTNLYMIKGVLSESPFFGTTKDEAWDIFYKYYNPEIPFDSSKDTPTNHNQIGYYLRYYGVIGLLFFLLLSVQMYKSIKVSINNEYKLIVLSYFILEIFYSFVHNNFLINSILMWSLISLIFIKKNVQTNE